MVRSLALQWLLKRHGLEGALRLGVRKTGNQLEAHAWIEYEGKPLIDPANVSGEFAPFEPISPDLRV